MSSVDRPCALCGDMMENPRPARMYCGDLCKESAKNGYSAPLSCADCGKRMHATRTSLPQGDAKCLTCRRNAHGTQRRYVKDGCRCPECIAWSQAEGKRVRARCREVYGMSTVAVWRMRYEQKHGEKPPGYAAWRSDWIPRAARLAIYERDGFTCQLCGEPIDRMAHPNSNEAASLDHIIPRKYGGIDDPSNLQTSHRLCNILKSDALLAA